MRSEVTKFMPNTVSIYTIATTYSSEDGMSTVRTLVEANVAAKVYDASVSEKQLIQSLANEGIETIETAKIDLPYEVELEVTNEVLHNGKYWNVISINTNETFRAMTQGLLYRRSVNSQLVD